MTQEQCNIPSTSLRTGPAIQLRTGFTTGACAAAAAKGAALMLIHQITVNEVSIELPGGNSATFTLSGQIVSADQASCFVIKDAGDDPDVTNGAEVHARVELVPFDSAQGADCRLSGVEAHPPSTGGNIVIEGGKGIGRVTKPGLAVPPGQWAINPVPRRMIEESVSSALSKFKIQNSKFKITISIPDGEERAKKTLNARLGIIGGLSILGTTGIVRPISAKAWTDTLDAALDVAKACGCKTVVLSTGRTSEIAAQNHLNQKQADAHHATTLFSPLPPQVSCPPDPSASFLNLPEEAYIMMGDHIAYALRACKIRGLLQPIIACQFAKLLKIACGHENTHAAASELDLAQLLMWAQDTDIPQAILESISNANTAREIAITCSFDPTLLKLVFSHARVAIAKHAPEISLQFLVADYSGKCIFNGL